MGWPKGMPRKGHVNQDGTAHKARGPKRPKAVAAKPKPVEIPKPVAVQGPVAAKSSRVKWTVPLVHPNYSIEQCANCDYPEADGGYCPECGDSAEVIYGVKF